MRVCTLLLAASLAVCTSACGRTQSSADADAELDEALAAKAMLLGRTRSPVFFLTSESDSPALGFGSDDAKLVVRDDPSENGRTPVRVLGRLHLEAYVPNGLVELRVQENTPVAGTALVLRAGDRVGLVEPRNDSGVHRVNIRVAVADQVLGPFEGGLDARYLSAKPPPKSEPLESGIAYTLPANTALPVYRGPREELLTLVPPLVAELPVTVLAIERNWFMVRVGKGPFLQGFTNAPLALVGKPAGARMVQLKPKQKRPINSVPWRIAQSPGPLLLVAAGTQLRFRGRIVATLRSAGWARALGSIDHDGDVEVLAAVDDIVTVRGTAPKPALTVVSEEALGLEPVSGPGYAAELGSAIKP
ncbi:MAG: hypothetical protein QM778_15785 [Myxococcales bacterium]